jgi:formylglycine-generating enzyme required for sulfatase activity
VTGLALAGRVGVVAAAIAALAQSVSLTVHAGRQVATPEAPVVNSIGMKLVRIPAGSMVVGKFQPPYAQPGNRAAPTLTGEQYERIAAMAKADASDGFTVHIPRPFYIGQYEVTQAEWTRVVGPNPSVFQGTKVSDDAARHPVENVTWADAQAFVRKLNALEKTTAYRLPTEFEWEYAARAGGDADIPWSAIREQAIAGYNAYFWTHQVGEKKPNAWGLYDMLGNVWEWVQDFYNEKPFADPVPPSRGREHVLKGGGFAADVKNAIPATHAAGPGSGFDVGFRVVRDR